MPLNWNTLAPQNSLADLAVFLLALLGSALLASLLGLVYIRFGASLSNRRAFARNFVLVAVTTTLIIAIVKSSLALSLGLVGALSIVRFRTALKEPEELAFLFMTIGIGLGFGAQQWALTVIAFVVLVIIVMLMGLRRSATPANTMYISLSSGSSDKVTAAGILNVLKQGSGNVALKRFDEVNGQVEVGITASFATTEAVDQTRSALKALVPDAQITIVDRDGVL